MIFQEKRTDRGLLKMRTSQKWTPPRVCVQTTARNYFINTSISLAVAAVAAYVFLLGIADIGKAGLFGAVCFIGVFRAIEYLLTKKAIPMVWLMIMGPENEGEQAREEFWFNVLGFLGFLLIAYLWAFGLIRLR